MSEEEIAPETREAFRNLVESVSDITPPEKAHRAARNTGCAFEHDAPGPCVGPDHG
jgi:hypothetical protein